MDLNLDENIQYYNLTQKKYQCTLVNIQQLKVEKAKSEEYEGFLLENQIVKEVGKLYKLGVILRETQREIENEMERGKRD